MEEENITHEKSTRKVVASAIDEDCLILEEPETGVRISWPLNKIPQPLKLGHKLNLILQPSAIEVDISKPQIPGTQNKSMKNDAEMRKMLEKLVN